MEFKILSLSIDESTTSFQFLPSSETLIKVLPLREPTIINLPN